MTQEWIVGERVRAVCPPKWRHLQGKEGDKQGDSAVITAGADDAGFTMRTCGEKPGALSHPCHARV